MLPESFIKSQPGYMHQCTTIHIVMGTVNVKQFAKEGLTEGLKATGSAADEEMESYYESAFIHCIST